MLQREALKAVGMTAPVDLRRRGSDEEICAVAVVRQVAAEAGDAGAVVGAIPRMQLHRAVPAQKCGLGVVVCEDLQPPPASRSVRTGMELCRAARAPCTGHVRLPPQSLLRLLRPRSGILEALWSQQKAHA